MIAYHGSQEYKDQFVGLLEWHKEQDKIVAGQYWEGGRGCSVGCGLESIRIIEKLDEIDHEDHSLSERYIGVPRILYRLNDGIFEGLPAELQQQWPIRFAAAIRPGADLSGVWPRFAVWLLADPDDGVIRFAKTDKQRAAIQNVADLYLRQIEGVNVSIEEWRSARSAAYAAYADADAAAAAADAAADRYSARQQARIRQADKLIALLEAA